jgi:hypothetical protein
MGKFDAGRLHSDEQVDVCPLDLLSLGIRWLDQDLDGTFEIVLCSSCHLLIPQPRLLASYFRCCADSCQRGSGHTYVQLGRKVQYLTLGS